jgi:hypothetical protein
MKESSQKGFAYHPKDGIPSFLFQFNNDGTLKDSHLTISNLRTKRTVKDAPEASLLPLSHYYWDKVVFRTLFIYFEFLKL